MERQRNENDCVGRRFEHWRQILRRCRGSDTHANTFFDPNRDSYAHGNCNCNGPAEVSTDAEAAPDSGTSTLEVRN